ncbi:bifunctional protein-disulfide isomerase/oxidoreductase DsbC [[Haemophilus] ducreyi]|uniref:bifunctional protein-disulfide isomerase/oxidoreductase DsbC n=1 Tax=Haemophilus ducreyi TaxID=730 RepID=UPI0006555634|nr:bifunctional protein-disulfide isomerase/oxidoreductase DsbC [[Haemophilus] ducreyi]AKO45562.1 protein-disulfide isomerase [[Haemophilus] ducreyi]AKO46949.1 protein-disulfide isomerase [[Haemophilus] ducreyi]AKO48292.1 protein-disulfide isomerase [[Haemophilus] ducreyi]AKO49680.1 protein-disulfide isomerase [[Haemophilus] ducreyi]ANF61284.1 protein-disulfide isomerase [[Haemophilus] ducreyi]
MRKTAIALFGLSFVNLSAMADDANLQRILENMGATNVSIQDSVLPGFRTAVSNQGVVQISETGRYVIQGKIFELQNNKARDITNKALLTELNALEKEMIIYPAKQEKHVVTVFMDISCHYCHLLHKQLKEYNDLGITIRFLAFPRGGMNTQTAKQMEAIWTSNDRVKALNDAENGVLPTSLASPNLVKKHFELGSKFGVVGTPNIVSSQGELIAGYVEPKDLAKLLSELDQ